jgi:SMODS-associated and fused to various effectors sensor domain
VAKQVVSRLAGDDYQHLYSWWQALSLLKPAEHVTHVRIEDPEAGSVDDVTKYRDSTKELPDEFFHYFFQIKYHVNHSEQYGLDKLFERKPRGTSLIQKFYGTWKRLSKDRPDEPILLHLVSNWSWAADDLGAFVSGDDDRLLPAFFDADHKSKAGQLRMKLLHHLGVDDQELLAFLRCVKFQLGFGCWKEIQGRVAERMELLGLKHDDAALKLCCGIIRGWIREGREDLTKEALQQLLHENSLYAEKPAGAATAIYLTTIQERAFALKPDYVLDWRDYFEGIPNRKGHRIRNAEDWDSKLLPELVQLEDELSKSESRLIRARGFARLSAWFAFGYAFSKVAGYTIEIEQGENVLWRSDAPPTSEFGIQVSLETSLAHDEEQKAVFTQVACGISVTGDISADVLKDLESRRGTNALLLLTPSSGYGMNSFTTAGDVNAFVDGTKLLLRDFIKRYGANRLLLYYFGPLSGACFLGQSLNALSQEIVIMEDQRPGYSESFHLSF